MYINKINIYLEKNGVAVIPGFQGISKNGDVTTIGRGGSDATAVALAASLGAEKCEIYTDVEGIFSADPRITDKAKLLKENVSESKQIPMVLLLDF